MSEPIPPSATARLAGARDTFTTSLSIDDLEAVGEIGYTPAGVVMGTAMCRIGLAPQRWPQSVELGMLSQTLRDARAAALGRLLSEARTLNATGVVGVRIELLAHMGAADAVEVLATGSALRGGDVDADTGPATGAGTADAAGIGATAGAPGGAGPWTAAMSGRDLCTLERSGYRPLAVVSGVCVYHVAHRVMQQMTPTSPQSTEVHQYTQALYDGRELALTRMHAEAEAIKADGIVAVAIEASPRLWGEQATEFLATGTAVAIVTG
jgi:uncharacterized protein YbjQ (UPF0145 family)